MKIRYLSDLHLECIKPVVFSPEFSAKYAHSTAAGLQRRSNLAQFIRKIPPGPTEVALLAGNVGNPREYSYGVFMEYMNANFKRTFVVAGNREYYGSSISETDNLLKTELKRFTNIRLLQTEFEIYEGRCFLGTTLWPRLHHTKYIHGFSSSECTRLNALNVEWLTRTLEPNNNCVVIAHYAEDKCKTTGKLDDLILQNKDKIKCWIYGHMHSPSVKNIGGVPMLCNPVRYEAADFSTNIVLP
jgi:predicted phosphohydrolase